MNLKTRQVIFGFGVFVFICIIVLRQIIDVDIWWHIKLGEEMLKTLGPPDFSTFYFSPINPHVSDLRYTWLGDILLALMFKAGGEWGLQILRVGIMVISAALVWDLFGRSRSPFLFLMLVCFILCTYQLQLIRNAIFSLPLFVGLFWLWFRARYSDKEVCIWWIPVLLTAWSCLHGTFMLGAGVFLFLVLGETYEWLGLKAENSPSKPPGKTKKRKKLDRDLLSEDMPQDAPPVRTSFLFLRKAYVALFLAFVGNTILNTASLQMLQRIAGNYWWLWTMLGTICLAALFFLESMSSWLIKKRPVIFKLAQILLALSLITIIGVTLMHTIPAQDPLAEVDLRNPFLPEKLIEDSFLNRLKDAFNSVYFVQINKTLISSDFLSPWEYLDEIYISLSFLFGLVTIFVFFILKPIPRSMLFAFFPVMVLSFGYKRTAGYLGVMSIVFILFLMNSRKLDFEKLWLWAANSAATLFFLIAVFFFPLKAGLWETHVPGLGRAPYFSDVCQKNVLEKDGQEPTFTVITNGGYLLHRWFPEKRVFVDGFFAPHQGLAFEAYQAPLLQQNPDLLFEKQGIRRAIVTHRDLAWLSLFSTSKNWYPESIDLGMMVFVYQPDWDKAPQPEILCSIEDFENLPQYFKPMFSNRFLEIPTGLIAKGRGAQAITFLEQNKSLVTRVKMFAEPAALHELAQNLKVAEEQYQGKNDLSIYFRFQLQQSINRKDSARIIELGHYVWEGRPEANLGLQIAEACLESGDFTQAFEYLNGVQHLLIEDSKFKEGSSWVSSLVSLWIRLATSCEKDGRFILALDAYEHLGHFEPERFSRDKRINVGLNYYRKLRETNEVFKAFEFLKELRDSFPESPFVLHNLSVHVFDHYEALGLGLDQAQSFAEQAIALCENKPIPQLDILYFNLSQIYREIGDNANAENYLAKAKLVAPQERKASYSVME